MTGLLAAAAAGFQEKPVTLAIFAITYLGIAIGHVPGLKLNRVGIALLGAIGMMVLAASAPAKPFPSSTGRRFFLLFGFFVISAQLRLSGFYDRVAGGISARLANPARFMLVLMLVTGGLSAFLNHDIVCFVFTPIVGTALLRKQINPVPFLVALAIASNHRRGGHADRQSAGHDDRPGCAVEFWPLPALERRAGYFCAWRLRMASSG